LAALVLIIIETAQILHLDFGGVVSTIQHNEHFRIFEFSDWKSRQNFFKQFFSGIFIVIVMTGLDQDMMQKNLSCKNLKEAQKNMYCYGFSFIPVNFLFLCLGILLLVLGQSMNLTLPALSDDILPMFAAQGYLGPSVLILFSIGIIAASFSSSDSALTSLTTSFCVDILGIGKESEEIATKKRRRVHFGMSVALVLVIIIFQIVNNKSVIDAIYTIASYTYGPLLGLFAFGLFTRLQPRDKYVPYVAVASPVICYTISSLVEQQTGYKFGYEMLMFNGALTFAGLLLISQKNKLKQEIWKS
jgi:Na+/proline symporter